ncbi:MAG: pentapeptide repeat-containing protein [Coleofasciculus sp. D1-CHI-01]|uniref:pentapeptide repeat-containing protein n=1 Tax=Coleofasciculus sp. D1-CHI-01 TaxID=3068482 RepID=UPI0032F80E9C
MQLAYFCMGKEPIEPCIHHIQSRRFSPYKSIKMTAEELLQRYAAGQRDFQGVNLSDEVLSWADLTGANLSGANLSGVILNWANLSQVKLRCANLSNSDLNWANLERADLQGANLSGAEVSAANLNGADWSGAIMPDGTIWSEQNGSQDSRFLSWLVRFFRQENNRDF